MTSGLIEKLTGTARRLRRAASEPDTDPAAPADLDELAIARLRVLPRFQPGTVQLFGAEISYLDAASLVVQYEEIFTRGAYDFATTTETPRILDCGANIGLSTIFWALRYPGAEILAFEPDPDVAAALRRNVAAMGSGSGESASVEVIEAAVWTSNGTVEFAADGADGGRIEHQAGHEAQGRTAVAVEVPTRRLADLLSTPTDLLKLDVEGAEVDVLLDCAEVLGNVDRLFVEYHGFARGPQKLATLLAVLDDAGFRTYVESVPASSPRPFVERGEHYEMDQQLNIWGFRD